MESTPVIPNIETLIPVLSVEDIQLSINFYVKTLGFTLDWGGDEGTKVASVSSRGHAIMLSQVEEVELKATVWIGIENDDLFAYLLAQEIDILQEPMNNTWGYDMKIKDLDGNILWLATGARSDTA